MRQDGLHNLVFESNELE